MRVVGPASGSIGKTWTGCPRRITLSLEPGQTGQETRFDRHLGRALAASPRRGPLTRCPQRGGTSCTCCRCHTSKHRCGRDARSVLPEPLWRGGDGRGCSSDRARGARSPGRRRSPAECTAATEQPEPLRDETRAWAVSARRQPTSLSPDRPSRGRPRRPARLWPLWPVQVLPPSSSPRCFASPHRYSGPSCRPE